MVELKCPKCEVTNYGEDLTSAEIAQALHEGFIHTNNKENN